MASGPFAVNGFPAAGTDRSDAEAVARLIARHALWNAQALVQQAEQEVTGRG